MKHDNHQGLAKVTIGFTRADCLPCMFHAGVTYCETSCYLSLLAVEFPGIAATLPPRPPLQSPLRRIFPTRMGCWADRTRDDAIDLTASTSGPGIFQRPARGCSSARRNRQSLEGVTRPAASSESRPNYPSWRLRSPKPGSALIARRDRFREAPPAPIAPCVPSARPHRCDRNG